MIDLLKNWLTALKSTAINTITSGRIYSGNLPAGYTPFASGNAVLISIRGGGPDYSGQTASVSVQFQCFASTDASAVYLAREVADAIDEKQFTQIKFAKVSNYPSPLTDPVSGWNYALVWADCTMEV
jgi:hypothetical protein